MSRLTTSIIASFVSRAWTALLLLLFVPVYIRFLGVEAYGVVGAFLALQAILSLLDLGFGPTITRELARMSGEVGSQQRMRDVLRTLELISWAVAAVIGLAILFVAPFIARHWLRLGSLPASDVTAALSIAGLAFALQWPTNLYGAGLTGLQKQVTLGYIVGGMAALRAGQVSLVEAVPPLDAQTLGQDPKIKIVSGPQKLNCRLYVNGRLSAAQTGATTWSATGPLTIGRGRWAGADSLYFKGAIDDVRAFGTALRDGEMSKVYDDSTPVMTGNWTFDNQTVADSSSRSNPTTTAGTASFVDGAKGKALALDGKSAATAQSPAVNPLGSLTVSAWVKLTYEPAVQTVLAQDGSRMSTFALQYRPEMDTWVFGAWTQDADDGEFVYARSRVPTALGEWMHLTGVYDHAAGELRLYVNGQLAGSREEVTLSPATGGLSIGRGQVFGAAAQFFTGQIDEVRADIGIVPDSEIAQRATRA